jgi:hypothetical protein
MSRIDRIYTTPELFARSRKWSIDDTTGKLTDHRMVSVQISAPGSPFIGDGIYTIPAFLMHDQKFLDFVIEIGQKAEQTTFEMRTNEENCQVLHKKLTNEIHAFGRKRAKVAIGALEQKKRKLQRKHEEVLGNPTTYEEAPSSTMSDISQGTLPQNDAADSSSTADNSLIGDSSSFNGPDEGVSDARGNYKKRSMSWSKDNTTEIGQQQEFAATQNLTE